MLHVSYILYTIFLLLFLFCHCCCCWVLELKKTNKASNILELLMMRRWFHWICAENKTKKAIDFQELKFEEMDYKLYWYWLKLNRQQSCSPYFSISFFLSFFLSVRFVLFSIVFNEVNWRCIFKYSEKKVNKASARVEHPICNLTCLLCYAIVYILTENLSKCGKKDESRNTYNFWDHGHDKYVNVANKLKHNLHLLNKRARAKLSFVK